MLYDRWREIAHQFSDDTALIDLATSRTFSFRQLALAAEGFPLHDPEPWANPRGTGVEFVLLVLAGWRERRVVCPLEPAQAPPAVPAPPAGAAHFKMTSGSTGKPRGIWFTATQLAADATQIVSTMGLRREWPNLAAISLAHSYGFSNLILPLLLHGIPLILVPAPLPDVLRRAGALAGDVTLPGVPVLWRAWHEANAIPPSTRLAISAGAPLPLTLETEVFQQRGLKIHNFYGASECGGIAFDSLSVPRPNARLAGAAMNDIDLTLDAEGCLIVRSPAAASGYWPEPDARLQPGEFRTRDLAEIRGDGLHLLGRAADTLHLAGRKIHPESVEEVVRIHPAVRDCVVFGASSPDPVRGDLIVAWVVASGPLSDVELRDFLLQRLPAWQVPDRFLFRETMPASSRGKISRAALREQFSDVSFNAAPGAS